jgi:phosphonate metabolism protein (transferase hexapeptide repeat family)
MTRLSEAPTIHESARVRDCTLGRWTEIQAGVSMTETTLGDYSYVVHGTEIIYATIGKFCSIAAYARINPGNHPLHRAALHHFTYRAAMFEMGEDDSAFFDWRRSFPVTLGNDVWIGHGAVVLPGVKVGTGAAVGANAVVSRDVPDFAVVAGVPARVLRFRFSEAVRAALLRLAWWDWDHATLAARLPDFRALGAEAFCAKYR